MKRCSYWYLYRFGGEDRFECILYGTKIQVLDYSSFLVSGINICKCSKAVARALSHDAHIPISDISNMEKSK